MQSIQALSVQNKKIWDEEAQAFVPDNSIPRFVQDRQNQGRWEYFIKVRSSENYIPLENFIVNRGEAIVVEEREFELIW